MYTRRVIRMRGVRGDITGLVRGDIKEIRVVTVTGVERGGEVGVDEWKRSGG